MKFLCRIGAMFVIAVVLFSTGCIPEEFYLRADMSRPDAAPLKIAAVLPMSGANRISAEQMAEGLQMAEQHINLNSHSGKTRVILKIFDSKGSAAGAWAAVEAAAKWGASGVIAGYSTAEVSAIIPHAVRLRMPVMIPLATSNEHSAISPFVFRNSYTDFQQSEMLANYLFHWRQVKFLGIFIDESGDAVYQSSIARDVNQAFRNLGGTITATSIAKLEPSDRDIVNMLKSDPEAILLTCGGKAAAKLIIRLRKAGFTGIICGADNWDDSELISNLDNFKTGDCLFTAFFNDENDSKEYIDFKKAFRKRFFHSPGACETQSYDALKLLVIGFSNAETLIDFERNWCSIRQHQGAAALYTMLPKGEIDRTIYINTIGIRREGRKLKPFSRFSHKLQYSKLIQYSPDYYK